MTRILNIISDMNIGGAGRAVLTYLKYMDRSRFEAAVALPKGSLLAPGVRDLGADVFEVEAISDRSFDPAGIRKLQDVIRTYRPDIVHTHGSLSGRIAGRRAGCRVIYTRHSVFPVSPKLRRGPGRVINKVLNEHYADRIIAVSPAAVENLTDGGIRRDLIDVVYNGVEQLTPASEDTKNALRREFGIPEDVFTAAILARIVDYKGHMDILEAASLLKERGLRFVCLFTGTGEAGYLEQVEARIREKDLSGQVKMIGFRKDVADILSILDVQLNASYGTEATSLSLLEGFSLGLPAVVSDYGGNPYVVQDGENGLVFPTREPRRLADALERLITDPSLAARLRAGARESYQSRFTAALNASGIESVYDKVMSSQS